MSSVTSGGNGERVTISPDGKGFVGLTQGQDISREGGVCVDVGQREYIGGVVRIYDWGAC